MISRIRCHLFVIAVFGHTAFADNIAISYTGSLVVDIGGTVTFTCTASRQTFWSAPDVVAFDKKQMPEDYVTIVTSSPLSVASAFQSRYKSTFRQSTGTDVVLTLVIQGFKYEDAGTYRCRMPSTAGGSTLQMYSNEITLTTVLAAVANLTTTATLTDNGYLFSYASPSAVTSCDVMFYGSSAGVPYVQIQYADHVDVTNEFSVGTATGSVLVGTTAGLKVQVQHFVYTSSLFTVATTMTKSLTCSALSASGVLLNSSAINVRGSTQPVLACTGQTPATVSLGTPDVIINCQLTQYTWGNSSLIAWSFTASTAKGYITNVTFMGPQRGYDREALQDELYPKMHIIIANADTLLYPHYTVTLMQGSQALVSTGYDLVVDTSTKSKSTSGGPRNLLPATYLLLCLLGMHAL